MPLSPVSREDAAKHIARFTGGVPDSDEGLCDLLRAEIHARKHAPRAATIERIVRLLAPAVEVDAARVADGCDALEREGDLMHAPGGVLHSTPVRAVVVKDRARLFGSLPTWTLASALGREVRAQGAARTVTTTERLGEAVEKLGGAVVTPDAWAGLDRAPRADAAFVARLDHRLEWEPLGAGALERDGALEWRAWEPTGDEPRWRRNDEGRLWWARSRFGGHHRAWTAGASPAASAFVELSADDADRARFALTRAAGGRAAVRVQRSARTVILEVPAWLPRPEYRWLSLHAEPAGEGKRMHWQVAADEEARITGLLADRLGLVVEVR